jgi:phospholipase/carboxylesterase
LDRREFLKISTAAGLAAACQSPEVPDVTMESATVTPRPTSLSGTAPRGFHRFGIWQKNDAFLYVPPTYSDSTPAPFLVLLHGAGARASMWESSLPTLVDDKGIVVMAFDSTVASWDRFILRGFGPDVERMNLALRYAFPLVNVDPKRVALGGFSDGASYALTLGIPNGDLFKGIIAFSAGSVFSPGSRGKPKIFISHGTNDQVIPIEYSRDGIVPPLRDEGYNVTFREFSGGHQIPKAVADEALAWLVALT